MPQRVQSFPGIPLGSGFGWCTLPRRSRCHRAWLLLRPEGPPPAYFPLGTKKNRGSLIKIFLTRIWHQQNHLPLPILSWHFYRSSVFCQPRFSRVCLCALQICCDIKKGARVYLTRRLLELRRGSVSSRSPPLHNIPCLLSTWKGLGIEIFFFFISKS